MRSPKGSVKEPSEQFAVEAKPHIPEAIEGKKRKIGITNPYIFVRFLSKSQTPSQLSKIKLTDKKYLDLLNDHFRKNKQITKDLTYDQLFDPKKSPLYKPPKGIRVGSSAGSPAITTTPTHYKTPSGTIKYIDKPLSRRSEIFADCIQGLPVNCYFHAALHSAVWVYYPSFPFALDKIAFYNNGVKKTIPLESTTDITKIKYPYDGNLTTSKLVCAQKTDANEYWAPCWEKAYGEFKQFTKSTLIGATGTYPNPPFDPNLLEFNEYDPLQSLKEITNKRFDFTSTIFGHPTAYDLIANPLTSTYDILNFYNLGSANSTSMITKYPTVAWTKVTCPAYSPVLVANHAYSVLGTFTPDNGITKYIVLRNPWGIDFGTGTLDPTIRPSIAQSGDYIPPTVDQSICLGPASTKGIFGMENGAFNTYFGGFGWIR